MDLDVKAIAGAASRGEKFSIDAIQLMSVFHALMERDKEIGNLKAGNIALLRDAERLDAIDRFFANGELEIKLIRLPKQFQHNYIQRGGGFDSNDIAGVGKTIREAADNMMNKAPP